jgi:hypothetical protein
VEGHFIWSILRMVDEPSPKATRADPNYRAGPVPRSSRPPLPHSPERALSSWSLLGRRKRTATAVFQHFLVLFGEFP